MGAGMYHIRVVGELDSTRIRAELARLSKTPLVFGGGKGTKGGVYGGLGADAEKASKKIKGFNGQVVQTNKNLKNVRGTVNGKPYRTLGTEVKQTTGHMKTFGTETLHVTKKVIQFGAVTAVIRGVTSGMADMVRQTFELDAALTEFKKVSDLSGEGLKRYTKEAYKAGRETAKTGVEMIDAATQFKKMGYSEKDALQLAKTATMFQNIADAEISAADSAKFINSQMKAYREEFSGMSSNGEKAAKVIDTVNEV